MAAIAATLPAATKQPPIGPLDMVSLESPEYLATHSPSLLNIFLIISSSSTHHGTYKVVFGSA
jgi:hypothetical protein